MKMFLSDDRSFSFGGDERAKNGKLIIAILIMNEIRGAMVVAAAWPVVRDAML